MKITNVLDKHFMRRVLLTATMVLLALAFLVALSQPAQAEKLTPPAVPGNIQAPEGSKLFFQAHAIGTQNYICMLTGSGYAWSFYGPQATLFNDQNEQVATHFLSPNPDEDGLGRPTWQHSQDTSAVWGRVDPGNSSSDSNYVAPGAIPWLLVTVAGDQDGPAGGDKLTAATHIQRINTSGGVIPTTGCSEQAHIGNKAFVPYTADYFFYR